MTDILLSNRMKITEVADGRKGIVYRDLPLQWLFPYDRTRRDASAAKLGSPRPRLLPRPHGCSLSPRRPSTRARARALDEMFGCTPTRLV